MQQTISILPPSGSQKKPQYSSSEDSDEEDEEEDVRDLEGRIYTKMGREVYNNNNNNNNNKLQLGCHPVAVVILHVHKYEKKVTRKFKSGGLHEKHVVVTWKLGNHLSIHL